MKVLLTVMTVALAVSCALGQTVQNCPAGKTCVAIAVNTAQVPVILATCEDLRRVLNASPADNNVQLARRCITYAATQHLRQVRRRLLSAEQTAAAEADAQAAGADIQEAFSSGGFPIMACGNGVVENDPAPGTGYTEECDDGNRRAGDGCDHLCNTETP